MSRNPRAHALTPGVAGNLLAQVREDIRLLGARADEVHVAAQDVDELRQLVQPVFPQHSAERRYAGVIGLGPHLGVSVRPVPAHRAELVDREWPAAAIHLAVAVRGWGEEPPAVEPHARLGVQDGPA